VPGWKRRLTAGVRQEQHEAAASRQARYRSPRGADNRDGILCVTRPPWGPRAQLTPRRPSARLLQPGHTLPEPHPETVPARAGAPYLPYSEAGKNKASKVVLPEKPMITIS
jgi:hypothetical protein